MFVVDDEEQAWAYVARLREGFTTYLRSLDEEDWDKASLCEGWRVRDVVAHLIIEYRYSLWNSWNQFILSGFNANRFLKQTAITYGRKPIPELLPVLESMVHEKRVPKSGSVVNVVVDLLIHEQDIRRAIGHQKDMPLDPLKFVFESWIPERPNLGERLVGVAQRIEDLQFIASDIDVIKGHGQIVSGKAQDILFAVSGRSTRTGSLSGNGAKILATR